jgi:hypothetical protein
LRKKKWLSMWSELLGPPGLILLAAVIGGAGAFWAAVKQSELRSRSEGTSALQTQLLRDLAARGGNQKELEELIRARSRLLTANQSTAKDVAEGIIKKLPELTAEYKALERNKSDAFDRQTADFRLKWEPLLGFLLTKFDSFVAECQKNGVDLRKNEVPFPDFPRSVNGPRNTSYKIRSATFHNVELYLEYEPIALHPSGFQPAQLHAFIRSHRTFTLALGLDEGWAGLMIPGSPDEGIPGIKATRDDIAPPKLLNFVNDSFAKVFERFLIEGNAESGN